VTNRGSSYCVLRVLAQTWLITATIIAVIGLVQGYTIASSLLIAPILSALFSLPFVVIFLQIMGPMQGKGEVHATGSVDLSLPSDVAFDGCVRAIRKIPKARVRISDPSSGHIGAVIPRSFTRPSQRVDISVSSMDQRTRIVVKSRPKSRFRVFDFGANERTVADILSSINRR
jgi:hypothetical protein